MFMIRSAYRLFALVVVLQACTHHTPPAPQSQPDHRVRLYDGGKPAPAGTHFAIQFNSVPAINYVADGHGGPPMLYHGHEIRPDELKSLIILNAKDARARFGDQTLDAAILIEFK